MSLWWALAALAVGFVLGLAASYLWRGRREATVRDLAAEMYRESEARRQAELGAVIDNLKSSFDSLSFQALSRSTEELLKLARTQLGSEREAGSRELESKKALIDQQLKQMTSELEKVSQLMADLEKDREKKFSELTIQLKAAGEQTVALTRTASDLRQALSSDRARGQWGERMAEDVLRAAGFVEGVNYLKQKTIEGGSRPDFTFLLPNDRVLNMDVKFPFDNYLRSLGAATDQERQQCCGDFLRDVRARMKEVAGRDYINPEQNTVDYALLFIPNEQVFAFIHEKDATLLDDGLKSRVVLCSPVTLFAVLVVVRQAVESFAIGRTSDQVLSLLGQFNKQWHEFVGKMDVLGKRIEAAQSEYMALVGTRRSQLEKPLRRIEELRAQRGLPAAPEEPDRPAGDE